MKTLRKLRAGEALSESYLAELVDAVAELQRVPRHQPMNELKLRYAVVTKPVQFRNGLQLGSGVATLYAPDSTGLLAPMGGFNSRTVWSDRGSASGFVPIPVGTLIKIYFGDGQWNVFNGDCSGQTITPPADATTNPVTPANNSTPVDPGDSPGGGTDPDDGSGTNDDGGT